MNKAWPIVSLGEVLAERRQVPSAEALAKGEIRIVAKIGFNDGKIQLRNGSETKTGMILALPGDVLISGINAAKGAIAIYGEENTEPIAATIHYGAYIPKKDRVHVKYLWWLLRSKIFRDLLDRYVPGGIKTELKAKRLLPIPLPLPSLEEQRRIVTKIDELAVKIEEARKLNGDVAIDSNILLESARLKIFQEMVGRHGLRKLDEVSQSIWGKVLQGNHIMRLVTASLCLMDRPNLVRNIQCRFNGQLLPQSYVNRAISYCVSEGRQQGD